jgi:hypothetical protein
MAAVLPGALDSGAQKKKKKKKKKKKLGRLRNYKQIFEGSFKTSHYLGFIKMDYGMTSNFVGK